jgi:DNA polymerase elongation subunit (family B)
MDEVNKFVAECRSKLGVSVGAENTFNKLILVGKKHYVGILSDPKKVPIIKGMEGIKSDRPEFIHVIFRQLVDDIQNDINPIHKLRRLLRQLDNRQVPPEQLAIPLVLRKNPEEYVQVCKQSRLGTKLGLRKDDTLVYYKCNKQEPVHDPVTNEDILKTVQESENAADISYSEYKDMLVNSVEDVLDILGYDVEKDLLSKPQLVNSSYFKRR